jgi:hypothetical protein
MLGSGVQVSSSRAADAAMLILDHQIQDFEMVKLRTVVGY